MISRAARIHSGLATLLLRRQGQVRTLYTLLDRTDGYDHKQIQSVVGSLTPQDRLLMPKRIVYRYLEELADDQSVAVRVRLLQGLTDTVNDPEQLKKLCREFIRLREEDIPVALLREIKIKYFKFLDALDLATSVQLFHKFSQFAKFFTAQELREVFAKQLRNSSRQEMLAEFVRGRHINDIVLHSLCHSPAELDQFPDRKELFEVLRLNGVTFGPGLREYFAAELEEAAEEDRQIAALPVEAILEADEETRSLLFADMSISQLVRLRQQHLGTPAEEALSVLLSAELRNREWVVRDLPNDHMAMLVYAVETNREGLLKQIVKFLKVKIESLKEPLLEEMTNQRIFEGVLPVIQEMVNQMRLIRDHQALSKHLREQTTLLSEEMAKVIERLALIEDLKQAFLDPEELNFNQQKGGQVKLMLKDFHWSQEAIEGILGTAEAVVAVNFGSDRLYQNLNVLVADSLVQMNPDQFARGLMYLANANYKLGDFQFRIESALKNLLQDDPVQVYRQTSSPDLEVAVIYYLTLTGLYSGEYLKPTAKWLASNPQKMSRLTPQQKTILGLVKAVHQTDSPPLFEGIPFTFPENFTFFPPTAFSEYFNEFFYYLFYKDVKKNVPVGAVNVHFVQQNLGLLCADLHALSGATAELNGLHALARMSTETVLMEVTVVKKVEVDRLNKKNLKMHLLRTETKKWKVDSEAREEHYEKATEGFLKVEEE